MFIDMILKTFPRSWRAAVALVVMLVSLQAAFTSMQALVVPGMKLGAWGAIKLIVELVVGIAAAIAFYYFQSLAEAKPTATVNQLDVLNNYQEAQKKEAALHHGARPVFSSHEGELKPHSTEKPST